jgi:ferrous iron transport protein B
MPVPLMKMLSLSWCWTKDKLYPDVAIVVTDVENLKRNLLLFTQIKDLEIPTILVINMADRMEYKGITLDIPYPKKIA